MQGQSAVRRAEALARPPDAGVASLVSAERTQAAGEGEHRLCVKRLEAKPDVKRLARREAGAGTAREVW